MSALSEVEEDFIGETLDILTDLCRSCGELKGAGGGVDRWDNIERGLHTIKGNSPAFGFEEFGEVASALLDRLKAESGAAEQGMRLAPLVLEFVTRSRQYLGLVREGRSKPFFGGIFKSLRDQLEQWEPAREGAYAREGRVPRPTRGGPEDGDAPGFAAAEDSRPRSKGGSSLTAKLAAILATAPPVKPNLEELAKLAARRLKPKSDRGTIDERTRWKPTRLSRAQPTLDEPMAQEPAQERTQEPARRRRERRDPERERPELRDEELREPELRDEVWAELERRYPEREPESGESERIEPYWNAPDGKAPIAAAETVAELEDPSTPFDTAVDPPGDDPVESAASIQLPETPPGGASVPHGDARVCWSEVAGLAFEARRAREAASLVSAEIGRNPDLVHEMARVSDFLADFCQWAHAQRMVPLQDCLDQCVNDLEEQATRAGLEIEVSAERTSRVVLPLLGELAAHAITELLLGLSLLARRGGERRALKLSVPEGAERTEIRMSGVGAPAALATRLRVYPVKRRLEEIGGDLVSGGPNEELVLVLPENIHSLDVCLLRSGTSHVGVPGHRVIGTATIRRGELTSSESECRCRFEGEEIDVLDLTDDPVGDAADNSKERCLVVLRSGSGRRGLLVDELLGQGEMLVLLDAGPVQDGGIVGTCFAASEERTVPLLDFKAPR